MAQNQNQGYQPIDESKVNWGQIEGSEQEQRTIC